MIIDIVRVKAMDDHTLECEMENGDVYKYDMSFVKNSTGSAIKPLADINVFKNVYIEHGALEWSCGYGIHSDTIIRDGELIVEAERKNLQVNT